MRNSEYLERFFRNLLLGETNELRNRYMVINAQKELVIEQAQHNDRTSLRFITCPVKRAIVIESINGESRIETSSDILGELYNASF